MADKYRVLIDWNKDGWYNAGVDASTPLNIVPDPLWGVNGVHSLANAPFFTNIPKKFSPSDYGFSVGTNVSQQHYYLGFAGMREFQYNDLTKTQPILQGTSRLPYKSYNLRRKQVTSPLTIGGNKFPVVFSSGVRYSNYTAYIGYDGVTYTPIATVTPGTQYTVRILGGRASGNTTVGTSVLSVLDQTGAVIATQAGGTGLATVQATDVTFTPGVGQTGIVLRLAVTHVSTPLEAQFFGIQLVQGAGGSMIVYADPGIKFDDTQFDAVLEAGQAYRAHIWFRQTTGSPLPSPTFTPYVAPLAGISYTALTPVVASTPVIGQWQRVDFTIPAQGSRSGFFIDAAAGFETLEFAGYQVVPGSNLVPFNTGELSARYEDITQYVDNLTWKIGKNEFQDALPFEGEVQIRVNNDDRIFSPSNTDSPLYGLMDQSLRVTVQSRFGLNDPWDTRWTGWTDTYEVDPGEFGQQKTLIRAVQGVGRMREGKLWFLREEGGELADVVQEMVNESGWITPSDAATSIVGYQTYVGVNAYVADPDIGWDVVQNGVAPLEFVGFDWNERTSVQEALTDLLNSQNAQLYIGREGKISVYNRDYFINAWLDYAKNLDLNQFPVVGYQYGEDIVNSITVTIQRKKEGSNGVLWESKRPIKVFPRSTRDFAVNYQFDEGQAKAPVSVGSTTINVYFSDPGLSGTVAAEPSSNELTAKAFVETLTDGANRTTVRLNNKFDKPVWFDVTINGSAVERGDNEVLVAEDEDAIRDLNEIHRSTYTNPIISDQESAFAAAWAILARRSTPGGEFDEFGFYVDTQEKYDLMQSLTVATKVIASETQTGENDLQLLIVEENGTITPGGDGSMKINYVMKRLDPHRYIYADANMEYPYDNLVREFPLQSIMDSTITPVSDKYTELYTGLWGGDYYLGANLIDVSVGTGLWYMNGGKPVYSNYCATAGESYGSIYTCSSVESAGTSVFIGSGNTTGGNIPIDPLANYLAYYWLAQGQMTGSGGVTPDGGFFSQSYSNWAFSGLSGTDNPKAAASSFLKREKQFRTQIWPGGGAVNYFQAENAYIAPYVTLLKAVPEKITIDSSKNYTVAVYARPKGGYAAASYTLEVIGTTGLVIASASSSFNSGSVDTLSVTFTGTSAAQFRLRYGNPGIEHGLLLYGFKMVEGSVAPTDYEDVPNPLAYDIYV